MSPSGRTWLAALTVMISTLPRPAGGAEAVTSGPVLFVVQLPKPGTMAAHPIAWIGPPLRPIEPESFRSQRALTRFVKQALAPGKRLRVVDRSVPAALVIVRSHAEPWDLSGAACMLNPEADVRPEGGAAEKLDGPALATDGTLPSVGAASRRPLTAEERERVVKVARERVSADERVEADLRAQLHPTEVSAFAQRLDGTGTSSWIGAVSFAADDYDRTEVSAVVALVILGRDGKQIDFQKVMNGPKGLELLGTVDLDGDGVDELVTRESHYESWTYVVWSRRSGRWMPTRLGTQGC